MYRAETPYGVFELPPLSLLPLDVAKAVYGAREQDRGWLLIERIASPKTLVIIDQLSNEHFGHLLTEWEKESEVTVNEILQILGLLKRHKEPLEADLMSDGLRLRHCPSEDFTWHDLRVYIRYLPVTSNLYGSMFPDRAGWTKDALLMAEVADSLHWLQWAKTKDGAKGRNRPTPIERPGVSAPQRNGPKPKALPLSALKERLAGRYKAVADKSAAIKNAFAH